MTTDTDLTLQDWADRASVVMDDFVVAIGEYIAPAMHDMLIVVNGLYRRTMIMMYCARYPRLARVWEWLFTRCSMRVLYLFPFRELPLE